MTMALERDMESSTYARERRFLEDLVPLEKLKALEQRAHEYATAEPFPHIVIDDIFAPEFIDRLIHDFPGPTDHDWLRYKARFENDKLQSTSELSMPRSVRDAIVALNSSTFVRFLERITGISGIVPDPHLYGGGMHQTMPGGHLGVHVDYNRHEVWRLDRRLNVLLYLNREWNENWGGALELWDRSVTKCVKRVFPVANRMLIFSTTEHSWHGHPSALACPPGLTRKSLALYYYTNGRPAAEAAESHNTIFRPVASDAPVGFSPKQLLRDLTPPILLRAAKALVRR